MKDTVRQNKRNFIILLLIAGIVSVPLMTDYVLMGDSTASSLAHIENIYKSLGKVFPVRVGTLGATPYGYSAAAFQADVFYLIPAALRLIGLSLGNSFKLTLFLFNILTAFIAFFSFKRCFGSERLGLVAGMLYTWCPYRITSVYTSGNLSEVFGWTFIPIVILGLWKLYAEEKPEDIKAGPIKGGADTGSKNKSRATLTLGLSLIAVSSTVFLFVITAMCLMVFFIMWRKSFRKSTIIEVAKTVLLVVCINAWFIIPMLLRMRDPNAVGVMIAEDVRGLGMFLPQYFTVFDFGGSDTLIWADGMKNAPAYGPGAAVIALVLAYIWLIFAGMKGREDSAFGTDKKAGVHFQTAVICSAAVFMILSTSAFPWDIFQNKNMLFSVLLAMMENPARWGVAADVCLIITACYALKELNALYGERVQTWLILAASAASFGTTQFLLGNILTTRGFAWDEDIERFGNIELPVIYGESAVWRLCEAVSVISIIVCVALRLIRRRKSVKEV